MTLSFLYRRPERNPLDLNNLPDEYSRDGKQVLEDHTSSPGKLHDHIYLSIYIYRSTLEYQRNTFFLYIFRILFHKHTPWEAFHFSQETKLNTARGLLPIPVVYSLTMKQCSPHFFFLIFLFFLFCPCIRFFSFFVSSPFPLLLRYSIS